VPSQSTTGKAFEYAVLNTLVSSIALPDYVQILENASHATAKTQFESLPDATQQEYIQAARPAMKMLLLLEPCIANGLTSADKLQLGIQSDQTGGEGDVRDIVISRPALQWEIGVSAKHQHEAMKHSRLSMSIDFGQRWLNKPCSANYFDEIRPIFTSLEKEKEQKKKWSEILQKDSIIYLPILKAFQKELLRLAAEHPTEVAESLALYLIGRMDFYKVMKLDQLTSIQALNLRGTLNQPRANIKSPVKLQKLKLPSRIIDLDFKRGSGETTTLLLVCDEGWQVAFRIHSASTNVEPSLKFDITMVGKPNSLRTFDSLWAV